MRKLVCALMVAGLAAAGSSWASADEKTPPAGGPADNAPAKPDGDKPDAKNGARKDVRTRLPIAVLGLSEKNGPQLVEQLVALDSIEEAEVDLKAKSITVVLASDADCTLTEISKALQKVKADVDPKRLTLEHPCTIALKGALDGTSMKDERERFRRHPGRSFALLPGQRLLDDLKAIEGVKTATFPDERSIKLGLDRAVSFARIAEHVANRGNADDGSSVVADVRWKGDKQPAARAEGKGSGGKGRGGKDPAEGPTDSGLR